MRVKQLGILAPCRQLSRDFSKKKEKTSPASAERNDLIAVVNVCWWRGARRNSICLFGMIGGSHQRQQPSRPRGGYMIAPERFADRQIPPAPWARPYMTLPDIGADN